MNIHCVLGRVASETAGVVVVKEDYRLATGNSNRWIFDVVAPYKDWLVELALLDFRSGKAKPAGTLSPRVAPSNVAAAKAAIFFPDQDLIRMCVIVPPPGAVSQGAEGLHELRFRVTVDGMHTLMR